MRHLTRKGIDTVHCPIHGAYLKSLLLLALWTLGCNREHRPISQSSANQLPEVVHAVELHELLPVVRIGGLSEVPLNLVLDFGLDRIVVAKDAIEIPSTAVDCGAGNIQTSRGPLTTTIYEVPSVKWDTEVIRKVRVDVINRKQSDLLQDTGLDGIFGVGLLGRRTFTLNLLTRTASIGESKLPLETDSSWISATRKDGLLRLGCLVNGQSASFALDSTRFYAEVEGAFQHKAGLVPFQRSEDGKTELLNLETVQMSGYRAEGLVALGSKSFKGHDGVLGSQLIYQLGGLSIASPGNRVRYLYKSMKDLKEDTLTRAGSKEGWAHFNVYVMSRSGLLRLTPKDEIDSLRNSAQSGFPAAHFELGKLLYAGGKQIDMNRVIAKDHLLEAGHKGIAEAYALLGAIYSEGIQVEKNDAHSTRLYWEGAKLGSIGAQGRLGWAFITGTGIEQNQKVGLYWLVRAAVRSDVFAQTFLGDCFISGKGTEKDPAKALFWYEAAARKGFPDAMYKVGEYHTKGWGGKTNLSLGRKWYERAAELGHPEARKAIE